MSIPSCQGLPSARVQLGFLDIVTSLGAPTPPLGSTVPLVVSVLCCKKDDVPIGAYQAPVTWKVPNLHGAQGVTVMPFPSLQLPKLF